MSLRLASLNIFPIKSLGGIAVTEARITDRGFEHDRRWMLVDANGRFISQREHATLACLHCIARETGFRVTDVRDGAYIDLPWSLQDGTNASAEVWGDVVEVLHAPMEVSAWFADKLGVACSLTYMPERSHRPIDPTYAQGITALNDGFPYLIVSTASLEDLNTRIVANGGAAVTMERFRPNMVIDGGAAFQEDGWREIAIEGARFAVVKPCARCVITTTDQRTGERGKEPLRTLATFRRRKGNDGEVKVDFAMNAVALHGDLVRVGDLVTVPMAREADT